MLNLNAAERHKNFAMLNLDGNQSLYATLRHARIIHVSFDNKLFIN